MFDVYPQKTFDAITKIDRGKIDPLVGMVDHKTMKTRRVLSKHPLDRARRRAEKKTHLIAKQIKIRESGTGSGDEPTEPDITRHLAAWLAYVKKISRITQIQIAKEAGIDRSYLTNMKKRKRRNPSAAIAIRITQAMGITIETLLKPPPDHTFVEQSERVHAARTPTERALAMREMLENIGVIGAPR